MILLIMNLMGLVNHVYLEKWSPFIGKGEKASVILGLVHSNVCGPMNTNAKGGYSYFITFTDDYQDMVMCI